MALPDPAASARPRITLIAAVAEDSQVIGDGTSMPWHLPEDLRHFKATTMGHPMIMGRTTFETMGVLPGRTSIILTSRPETMPADGPPTATSLSAALAAAAAAPGGDEIFVVGGGQVYRQAIEIADRLLISWVEEAEPFAGSVTFPPIALAPDGPWEQVHSAQFSGWRLAEYQRG